MPKIYLNRGKTDNVVAKIYDELGGLSATLTKTGESNKSAGTYEIVITADSGYRFDTDLTKVRNDFGGSTFFPITFSLGDTKGVAELKIPNAYVDGYIETVTIPDVPPEPEKYPVKIMGSGVTATATHTETSESYPLELNVENLIPEGNVTVSIVAESGKYLSLLKYESLETLGATTTVKLSPEQTEYSKTHNFKKDGSYTPYLDYTVETEILVPETDVIGFNNVYIVDKNKLQAIAGERFEIYTGSGTTEIVDLGEYIINILQLPFTVPIEIIGDESKIVLGHKITNVLAPTVLTDRVVIDLGTITVPQTYNNSYDFMNTDTVLHLPFSDAISLEPSLVVGETIGVQYIVDLYTGDTTINISSTKSETIESNKSKLGREIPFTKTRGSEMMFSSKSSFGLDNGVTTATILVTRNVPTHNINPFSSLITVQGTLFDVKGLVKINDIILNTKANANEKQKIISLLESGVNIK